jgi:hypothetical protein
VIGVLAYYAIAIVIALVLIPLRAVFAALAWALKTRPRGS